MMFNYGRKLLVFIFAIAIVADVLSKSLVRANMHVGDSFEVISGLFNITYVLNSGVVFGIGADGSGVIRYIYIVVAILVAAVLLLMLKKEYKTYKLRSIAYTLALAGALGNITDRITLGSVVDFLDFYHGNLHWFAFNLADAYITIAVGLLLIDTLKASNTEVA
ncbi:signal peptidase II [Deferribacterales bacterium RsTz2092]|nr:lipoprotein signal peptidase [Deferribacterales bacterium]